MRISDWSSDVCSSDLYSDEPPINLGTGQEIPIADLAELTGEIVGYRGRITFDTSRPDGTPRKVVDTSRLRGLGWQDRISLRDGLKATYDWEAENHEKASQGEQANT